MLDAQLANVRAYAAKVDLDWPATLQSALDKATAFQRTALTGDRKSIATAVHAAIDAGRDPATDDTVLDALTRYQLAEACPPGVLADIATRLREDALHAHADDLHRQLHDAVHRADQIIDKARQAIPNLDPFDRTQVAGLGPEQASRWVQAQDAALTVGHALTCRKHLMGATTDAANGGRYADVLAVADLTLDQCHTITTVRPDYRDVIAAGYPLDLANPAVHRDRIARHNQATEAQRHDQAHAFRNEYRRTHAVQVTP